MQRCDRVIVGAFCAMIYFLPISNAFVESFFGVILFTYLIKRSIVFSKKRKELSAANQKLSFVGWIKTFLTSFKPAPSVLNQPLAFYTLIVFVTCFTSFSPEASFKAFMFRFLQGIFTALIFVESFTTRKRLVCFLCAFFISALLISVNGVYQYIVRTGFIHFHPITDGRVTSCFRHANDFGAYLAIILPLLLSFSFLFYFIRVGKKEEGQVVAKPTFFESNWMRLAISLLFLAAGVCLVFTYSRAAWLAFVGSLFMLSFKRLKVLFIIVAISLMCFSALIPQWLAGRTKRADVSFFDSSSRGRYWKYASYVIKDHMVTGTGLNTYVQASRLYYPQQYRGKWDAYPHNGFLRIAAETGLFGLAAFLWLLIRLFYNGMRNLSKMKDPFFYALLAGSLAGLLGFLIVGSLDTAFSALKLSSLMWIVFGLIAATQKTGLNET